MKLELKRPLKIECYRVIAEIEQAQKRAEILAILLLAQERGAISARDISDYLLDGRPETVGKRLLQMCDRYKLLESSRNGYVLTDTGNKALIQEKVFVPEQGTWEIWVTDDPLWPAALLQIKPHQESNAREEAKRENKQKLEERKEAMNTLDDWIQETLIGQKSVTPLLAVQSEYRFADLKGQAERVNDIALNITLTLTIPEQGKPNLVFNDGKKDYRHDAPEITFDDAWRKTLEHDFLWNAWDVNRRVLRVDYDRRLNSQERANFRKSEEFPSPSLDGLGKFNSTTVENIPIAPATQADADAWATWLLAQEINRYAAQGEFAQMQAAVRPRFPDFRVNLPEQAALAQALRNKNPQAFWQLQAPLDWNI